MHLSISLRDPIRVHNFRPGRAVNFIRIPSVAVLTTLALLVAIAVADEVTGDQITLSVLYMFPVIIASWVFGVEAVSWYPQLRRC